MVNNKLFTSTDSKIRSRKSIRIDCTRILPGQLRVIATYQKIAQNEHEQITN